MPHRRLHQKKHKHDDQMLDSVLFWKSSHAHKKAPQTLGHMHNKTQTQNQVPPTSLSSALIGKTPSEPATRTKHTSKLRKNDTAIDESLARSAMTDLSAFLQQQKQFIPKGDLMHQLQAYADKSMGNVEDTLAKVENQFQRAVGTH
mmetsp:Transcript_7263/g.17699  ORF Transcript_7263/g.17699 Transcript_7263/m.17699 type:complete len:146 (-) Transcript_7263:367-804(-)